MSVHHTKDGRWFAAYWPTGEGRQARKYFGRGRDAELAARQFDLDYAKAKKYGTEHQVETLAESPSFLTLAQRYLDQHTLADNTAAAVKYTCNRHIADLWGRRPAYTLNMRDLADLDALLIEKGLSLATRNRYRSYCRAILEWAVKNDFLEANPFARFRPQIKKEGRAPDLPTPGEMDGIFQAAPEHLKWAMICILALGVRPGRSELFAIRIQDVDFDRGGVWIQRPKTYAQRVLQPAPGPFLARLRDILAYDPTREFLIEYVGRPVKSLKTSWRATLKRAKITRRIRLYDLRHAYATALLRAGADAKVAAELLGHASPRTTLATYYHLQGDQLRAAVDRLVLPLLPPPVLVNGPGQC